MLGVVVSKGMSIVTLDRGGEGASGETEQRDVYEHALRTAESCPQVVRDCGATQMMYR